MPARVGADLAHGNTLHHKNFLASRPFFTVEIPGSSSLRMEIGVAGAETTTPSCATDSWQRPAKEKLQ